MPPSEAEKHGYERANKHPKSTKFGRQNPIAERWNSEEQLVEWRKAWADVTNRYLEQYGHDERIDHRSHADRGLTEQPTIHEGVVARALEKKGIISDRCEINRQIKADNALLRELKAAVKKLMQAVKNTVPAIAEAMEKIRSSMLIFSYQLRYIGIGKNSMGKRVKAVKPELERYAGLVHQIKAKLKERKNLLAEKKETPFYQIPKLHDLTHRITELTEEIEELKTEKDFLLRSLDCADDAGISDVKKEIATLESALKKLSEQEEKYSAELDAALKQYTELKKQAAGMDAAELMDARLAVREEKERSAVDKVKSAYVTYEKATELKKRLLPEIQAVGVFVNEHPQEVAKRLENGMIDIAQLHGDEDEAYIKQLRLLTDKPIIKAFRIETAQDIKIANQSTADYILLDSGAGTGTIFDWGLVNSIGRQYFLAGGLDACNVADAVKTLHPFAVDVSSGIETNGVKDKIKMAAFVAAVRKEDRL